MSNESRCALGLDVGGTKIAGGIVIFPEGQVVDRKIIPTRPERGGEAVLDDVIALIEELRRLTSARQLRPAALGLGLAELVDHEGHIASAATIAWLDLPVQARLSALLPTVLEADVRAAARAEAAFGAGRPYADFLFVTVGTGISCCLMRSGQPHAGARGFAGTFASAPHLVLDDDGLPRVSQALETIASGPALAAHLRKVEPSFSGAAPEVCARANQGEPRAQRIVDGAGLCLGAAIGHLINTLDPEAVILGGGLGLAGGRFREMLERSMREHCWSPFHRSMPLLQAGTGPDGGIIGSAWAALNHVEGHESPTRR